jgi:Tat protein secretion system quality control protein TatD with DNase activity
MCNRIHKTADSPAQQKGLYLILDHLVSAAAADFAPETLPDGDLFVPIKDLSVKETIDAQVNTADWLKQITDDDDEVLDRAQEQRVGEAFGALITQNSHAKEKFLELELPEEVKSAVSMVTAYQWKFVEQAQELRSMSVAKIVKETDHPDARIRLKALELLGKVTEVALFTDRVEVKKTELSDAELEAQIKKKLEKYMGVIEVTEVEEIDVVEKVIKAKSYDE